MMTAEEMVEKLNEFTRSTGIIIGGCGCCQSPFAYVDEVGEGPEMLEWDATKLRYDGYWDVDGDYVPL